MDRKSGREDSVNHYPIRDVSLFSIFLLADIRFVDEGGVVGHVHTCNGTAVASSRALITLMETHQNVSEEHLLNSESGDMGTVGSSGHSFSSYV